MQVIATLLLVHKDESDNIEESDDDEEEEQENEEEIWKYWLLDLSNCKSYKYYWKWIDKYHFHS